MVHFPEFPTSVWAGLAIFIIVAITLWSAKVTGIYPNPVVMYLVFGLTALMIIGVVGWKAIIEHLGFDVVAPGERLKQPHVWVRYPILIVIGLISAYFLYRLFGALSMALGVPFVLFPMDLDVAHWMLALPLFYSTISWLIVAFGEEFFRVASIPIFANWGAKRFGLDKHSAVTLGIILSSVLFILVHIIMQPAYANLITLVLMTSVVIFFTSLGYVLTLKGIFGRIAFFEFSIIPGIAFHFLWNYLLDLELRLVVSPLIAPLLGLV